MKYSSDRRTGRDACVRQWSWFCRLRHSFVAAFAVVGALSANSDEVVVVIENMPDNCQRESDGRITCDGYTVDEFCRLFGSSNESFCYGGGGSGSGGSGSGSGSGSGGGNGSSGTDYECGEAKNAAQRGWSYTCKDKGPEPSCACGSATLGYDSHYVGNEKWTCPSESGCEMGEAISDVADDVADAVSQYFVPVACRAVVLGIPGVACSFAATPAAGAYCSISAGALAEALRVCPDLY